MADPSSEELFERWKRAGDMQALGAAFDRTAPELLRLARRLCRDRSEAEDLVQATWLGAIESAQRFDPARKLTAWLAGILVRQAGLARRRTERADPRGDLDPAHEPDPAAPLESRELADALARSLEHLTPAEREVVVPLLLEEQRTVEIARELALRPRTAERRISRGLAKLRRLMGPGLGLGLLLDRRALAQIKTRVAAHAAAANAGAAGAPASLAAGGLALSNLAAAAILVAALLTAWYFLARTPESGEPVLARAATVDSREPAGDATSAIAAEEDLPVEASRTAVLVDAAEQAATPQSRPAPPKAVAVLHYGRVVAEEDAAPIEGADVEVISGGRVRQWIRVGDTLQPAPRIRSDREGRFEFTTMDGLDDYLRVSADGFGRAIAPFVTDCSTPDRALLIRIRRAGGVVATLRGSGAQDGVRRRVVVTADGTSLIPRGLPELLRIRIEDEAWSAELGAEGVAELTGLPSITSITLAVWEGEKELLRLPDRIHLEPGETRRLDIALNGGATIVGKLLDEADRPLGAESMWLVPRSENFDRMIRSHAKPRQRVTTDARGSFEISDVPPGEWLVGPAPTGSGPDALAPFAEVVTVRPDLARIDVTVHAFRDHHIRGRVVDAAGNPVRVSVTVLRSDPPVASFGVSGEDGSFSVGPLPPGDYVVSAGEGSAYATADAVRVQAGASDVLLTVSPGATLTCRVVDERGVLVAFPKVSLARTEPEAGPFKGIGEFSYAGLFVARTSEPPTGVFEFHGLTSGGYVVSASTGSGEFGFARVELEAGPSSKEVVLVVHPGARLRVTCVGQRQSASCGVEIDGIGVAGDWFEPKETAVLVVPAGTLRVLCRSSLDGQLEERTIHISIGEEKQVEFAGGE